MFSARHAIWQFANAGDELDDWLPHAEDLIRKWSSQNNQEVGFESTFEIIIATYLLIDDLLPASARVAFAKVMLESINEATNKKLPLKCLHISPPKPGRKENRSEIFSRFHEVKTLIRDGKTATEAYKVVAKKRYKSPDTIRRDYERIVRKGRKRKEAGENDR